MSEIFPNKGKEKISDIHLRFMIGLYGVVCYMTTPNPTPEAIAYQAAREAASRAIADLLTALDGLYRIGAGTLEPEQHESAYYTCQEAADRAMAAHIAAGEAWRRTQETPR